MRAPSVKDKRRFALEVIAKLREAGHEALFAGGCVRDMLLGLEPKDFDVATEASPDRVREVFGKRRTLAVGAAFGVIAVIGPKGQEPIEVATYRSDLGYSDGRRPDSVRFTNAEEDAQRRDFTINGLFYDPVAERVIDYVRGEIDLGKKLIRAIGVPRERFEEDRLRMLRAVRFAVTLDFEIEPETLLAIQGQAGAISEVSAERIGAEVRKMLISPQPAGAIQLLMETGLLEAVLPELARGHDELARAVERLGGLRYASCPLALATALLGTASATEAARVARRLKWIGKEADAVAWLLANHGKLTEAASLPWSTVQPRLADERGADLLELHRVSGSIDQDSVDYCVERLGWPREALDPAPLLVGADLIRAGLRPGPRFSELLAQARRAQLDGEVSTSDEALELLGLA